MLISKLVGERTKENPADAIIDSHKLLVRAGFIKLVANGIWTLAAPAKRICRKIENIIRDEMDKVDGQEVSFPVVMPKELWEDSGRYYTIQDELVRFKDRNNRDMLLGMTHEEAAVHLCRNWVNSYQQLPLMIYQFQTKFRDEARARGGLIRVREFIMKDAYSFHTSQEDLESYYMKQYDAYTNIFRRVGMKRVVSVKSDSGMMGGNIAHEYMLLTPVGEDTIALCTKCDYRSNMEVAECVRTCETETSSGEMETVFTGDKHDIESVCKFLNADEKKSIKAVCFGVKNSEELVLVFIRGDLDVNEAKLKKLLKKDVVAANLNGNEDLHAGNIGCVNLRTTATVIYDLSLKGKSDMVTGANKEGYHLINVDMARDVRPQAYYDVAKVTELDVCPVCGAPLILENGIEVGNIFQLGTKYTKAMGMTVLNSDSVPMNPIMGCYGIGVGRALAAVAEESHDDYGLIWPMTIAPWQVYLCALRMDDETVAAKANKLYEEMTNAGIEVLFDDRNCSAGVKFSDCDLIGIPLRVVISPRSLSSDSVEVQSRDKSLKTSVGVNEIIGFAKEFIEKEIAKLS